MIEVKELTRTFQSGDHKVTAVNDLNFQVEKGVFGAIVGKSGSGKSTLLSLLGALDKPTKGTITIDGQDLTKMGDHRLIGYRRDKIGFVFQNYNLIPNLTALENVMLPMEFAGVDAHKRRTRAEALLKEVGLSGDKLSRRPGKLSGGEQQRVAIARALSNNPQLILADEPTGNLDSATGKIIIDLLKNLAKTEDTTILAVTHDEGIASKAEVVFRLRDGKLIKN
jgi:putative ABC transport system ATP-binding protein